MRTCSIEGCSNLVEGRTDMCGSHNFEQRRADKRALNVKMVQPVKKVSSKRAEEKVKYDALRIIHLREFPECQVKLKDICTKKATTIHHAGKRGKNYLNRSTFLSACMECHDHLETKLTASERREKGLLI